MQTTLFAEPLTRQQAKNAYRRCREWEQRQSAKINREIMRPEFGCMTRLHNCIINFETGYFETEYNEHKRQCKLAKLYLHKQDKIWSTCNRLQAYFAKFF